MKTGFEAIYDKNTKILILGSAPSVKSLELQQYYANKGNQFWKIIAECLCTSDPIDYEKRLQLLTQNHIGLWDVYSHFNRIGSLDSDFKQIKLNNFDSLFPTTSIKLIIANGDKAYQEIVKSALFEHYMVIKCLSTSGANNGKAQERKIEWKEALQTTCLS